MSGKTRRDRYRVLFVVWTLAAISMALGVLRMLPEVNVFALVILALSAVSSFIWRRAYRRETQNDVVQRRATKYGKRSNNKLHGGKRI